MLMANRNVKQEKLKGGDVQTTEFTAEIKTAVVSVFFFSGRRRHTRYIGDWSSDVCSSDLAVRRDAAAVRAHGRGPAGRVRRAPSGPDLRRRGRRRARLFRGERPAAVLEAAHQIGRATCRERA